MRTIALCCAVLVGLGAAATGAFAAPAFQGENATAPDLDAREGRVAPSDRQRALSSGLQVTWNRFGTPHAVAPRSGYLTTGLSSDQETAARQWISRNLGLLGIGAATARDLEVVTATGHAVLLRQRFDGLAAGRDGLIALGVRNGRVAYVSSSLARDTAVTGDREMGAAAALRAAARNARLTPGTLSDARTRRGWTVLDATGLDRPAQARLVALPTPRDGIRKAWETSMLEGDDGVASFVDAETGEVLVREGLVDHLADNPTWTVFPNTPPMNYATTDTRVRWCWLATANCALVLDNPASLPWDIDARRNRSTLTTEGNNAVAVHNWDSNDSRSLGKERATTSRDREYTYPWSNQWFEARCNPAVFRSDQRNEIDAARANLFAMHNRMHDWSYGLGFTERTWNMQSVNFGRGGLGDDPEWGNAQAGGRSGGPPQFAARNNANQFTPAEGLQPITNMYLWQPLAAGFYAPCVDGDYDMSVIGHEYGHAISNRMAGGPNAGLSGNQAQAMGESWSDLMAIQYLAEHGFAPIGGENPFAVGPYVTGDQVAGIRNFGMNASPLNYSDAGYDFVCNDANCTQRTQVHADGEIWSATNYDIRQAFIGRYGASGSRRWIQLVFDAWLLMATGQVSMVDARNAILAADQVRNNGANQDIMWNAFAKRGLGQAATSNGTADFDPVPSFESPHADEAVVRFRTVGDSSSAAAQLFVGRYEARATPIADTDPATDRGDTFALVPGTYELVARAAGFGHMRTTLTVSAGQRQELGLNMPRNLASSASGATATGNGVNLGALIDDTELTNWASLGSPIAGKQVTVRLGRVETFDRIQVSAMLRHRTPADTNDSGSQNRFSALRRFELLACEAGGAVDCTQDAQFSTVYTSPADAFPAVRPRPRAPDLIMRSFDVASTRATHVRLRVLTNQCTGTPGFHGDQDDDPRNVTDCIAGSTQDDNVRAAELQVFR